jgi:hypothetical protein
LLNCCLKWKKCLNFKTFWFVVILEKIKVNDLKSALKINVKMILIKKLGLLIFKLLNSKKKFILFKIFLNKVYKIYIIFI